MVLALTGSNNTWPASTSLTMAATAALQVGSASTLYVVAGAQTSVLSIAGAGQGVVLLNSGVVVVSGGASITSAVPVTLQSGSTLTIQSGAAATVNAQFVASNSSVSGLGTLYLSGTSSFYAGCSVTSAVQFSTGTHTLYDLDQQTWQPVSLIAGQPTTCDYCYNGPTIVITPSSAVHAPTASVAAYLGRLTFYGQTYNRGPSATLSVASTYVLSIGVLDGILGTNGGIGGAPHYTIQSADTNLTTVLITSSLTSSALYMSLQRVQLRSLQASAVVYVLPAAQTTTLYSSSQLTLSAAQSLQLSGGAWTVQSGDGSAGQMVSFTSANAAVSLLQSAVWSLQVPLSMPAGASILIGSAASLTTAGLTPPERIDRDQQHRLPLRGRPTVGQQQQRLRPRDAVSVRHVLVLCRLLRDQRSAVQYGHSHAVRPGPADVAAGVAHRWSAYHVRLLL